ncbi:MAG: hypothetical protein FJW40_21535 [Acidobacteria bacterium]|nr:hypothetical protein [Acidobacteriota bacterium]
MRTASAANHPVVPDSRYNEREAGRKQAPGRKQPPAGKSGGGNRQADVSHPHMRRIPSRGGGAAI